MKIDLTIQPERRRQAIRRVRERNIIIPTFAQMKNPSLIPAEIKHAAAPDRTLGRHPSQSFPHHLEERAQG